MGLTERHTTRQLWAQGITAYCGKCGHKVALGECYRKPSGQVAHSYCGAQVKLKPVHSPMGASTIDLESISKIRNPWPLY